MSRPDLNKPPPELGIERSVRVAKENPVLAVGVVGGASVLLYRIIFARRRAKNTAYQADVANYMVVTRMYAQGLIVMFMGISVAQNMYNRYTKKQRKLALEAEETEKTKKE